MGFLSNLLPTVIGVAADVVAPEAAPFIDAGIGALRYKQTGSLMQGLSAGLGAYGGGQLAGGLMGLGTSEAGLTSGLQAAGVDATPAQWNAMTAEERAAALPGQLSYNPGYTADTAMTTDNPAIDKFSQGYAEGVKNAAGDPFATLKQGASAAINSPSALANQMGGWGSLAKTGAMAASPAVMGAMQNQSTSAPTQSQAQTVPYYKYSSGQVQNPQVSQLGTPVNYFNPTYTPYSTPQQWAHGGSVGMATGGISDLGGYSDGGRLLKGPGDGVSDSIPASIADKQPARLADGEFVVPARIVSELGNGSTEAGARQLYSMMDRVQKARKKTVGKDSIAANTKSAKYLPA